MSSGGASASPSGAGGGEARGSVESLGSAAAAASSEVGHLVELGVVVAGGTRGTETCAAEVRVKEVGVVFCVRFFRLEGVFMLRLSEVVAGRHAVDERQPSRVHVPLFVFGVAGHATRTLSSPGR